LGLNGKLRSVLSPCMLAMPQSADATGVSEPVLAVLEVAGGTAKRIGMRAGDTVYHRFFRTVE